MTYEPSKLIITFSTPKTHVEKHETMITMIKINCTSFRVIDFQTCSFRNFLMSNNFS